MGDELTEKKMCRSPGLTPGGFAKIDQYKILQLIFLSILILALGSVRLEAADIKSENGIDHPCCDEGYKVLQARRAECGEVHSEVQAGIQDPRAVRHRFDRASIAAPVRPREGCVCTPFRA